MDTTPIWRETRRTPERPPLASEHETEVLVVGGGIAGISIAFELLERGYDVTLVEQHRIGSGTTGHTTAKLTTQHGLKYDDLIRRFGPGLARRYGHANTAAIDIVSSRIDELGIDAAFKRTPSYVYTPESEDRAALDREYRAVRRLGLPASNVSSVPAPIEVAGAIRFDDQAQFHPQRYLTGMTRAILERGANIFEGTRATELSPGNPCVVETTGGPVTANHVVLATLFPFSDRAAFFARLRAYRSYLLAVRLDQPLPDGMYLSTESPPVTFRAAGDEHLIVGGESHPTEQTDPQPHERFERCEEFAKSTFAVKDITHQWAAHDLASLDGMPYIGSLGRLSPNTYVATGFGKWGLTNGTLAGPLIAELIDAGDHPWADVFDPRRVALSDLRTIIEENVPTTKRLIWDWIGSAQMEADALPECGQGCVLKHRGRPLAVYRDADGALHTQSAVCPHMYCLVGWNSAENTWDCPCHGSRFKRDGSVAYGPATQPLADVTIEIPEEIRSP